MAVTFIDISVHPMVRPHILAAHPALVWSADMTALLWANAEGARLMGERRISDLLDLDFTSQSDGGFTSLAAQMEEAARALSTDNAENVHFGLRKNDGLVRFTLDGRAQRISLSAGIDAVLMVFEGGQRLGLVRPGDKTGDPVQSLLELFDDQPGCAAILDADGSLIADRGGMELARFRQGDLAAMHADVQSEDDLLIKRVIRSDAGAHPAGIALLQADRAMVLIAGDVLDNVPANLLPNDDRENDMSGEVNRYREPSAFARRTTEAPADNGPRTVQLADMERIRKALTGNNASIAGDTSPAEAAGSDEGLPSDTSDAAPADFVSAVDAPADAEAMDAGDGERTELAGSAVAVETDVTEEITSGAQSDILANIQADGLQDGLDDGPQNGSADKVPNAPPAEGFFGGLDYWYFRRPPAQPAPPEEVSVQPNESEPVKPAQPEHAVTETEPADALNGATEDAEALIALHEAQLNKPAVVAEDDERSSEDLDDDGQSHGDEQIAEATDLDQAETKQPGQDPAADNIATATSEPEPEPGPELESEPESKPEPVSPAAAVVRFAFTSDAEGRITSTSPEFAAIVGDAANPSGHIWSDVQAALAVDEDNRVGAALSARDTWSGRLVIWPIAGTDTQVPVELGALPNFSRAHGFTGFRGFGVLRVAEKATDNAARGLNIEWPSLIDDVADDQSTPAQPIVPSEDEDDFDRAAMRDIEADVFVNRAANAGAEAKTDRNSADNGGEGAGVLPFLRAGANLAPDQLNNPDQDAHDDDGTGLPAEEAEELSEAAEEIFDLADATEPQPLAHLAEPSAAIEKDDELAEAERSQDAELEAEIVAFTNASTQADMAGEGPQKQDPADFPDNLKARLAGFEGLDEPVLCYRNERILFANQALLALTGYRDAAAIEGDGGLSHLLDDGVDAQTDTMLLTRQDGTKQPVSARLRSIRWESDDGASDAIGDQNKALVITLSPVAEEVTGTEEEAGDRAGELEPASSKPVIEDELSATLKLGLSVPQLHEVLATATDGVVVLNAEGRIHALNSSAEALFGFDSEAMAGRNFATLFAPDSQTNADAYMASMMGTGVEAVLNDGRELTGFEASGGLIPLFVTIGRLAGTGDRVAGGFCAVLRDITQWKKVERELLEARREAEEADDKKSQFLAQISHEIRTPLNAIIGFSEVMAEERFGPLGSPRYGEYLRDINRSGAHVLDLVNDLLDISKIESGGLDLDTEEVDLNEIVANCVSLMQPEASTERVIMRTSLSASVPRVLADRKSLRQVTLNLLSNALKFTNAGGQVIISTARMRTGDVELRIRDTGIGMTRDELEHALKPYRQLSNGLTAGATTRSGEVAQNSRRGTGLGLPLTKAMVEANGAQFAIHSEPEQGTWVVVGFPRDRVLASD